MPMNAPSDPSPRRASPRGFAIPQPLIRWVGLLFIPWLFALAASGSSPGPTPADPPWLSPAAILATPDGRTLYVACATGHKVLAYDPATRQVTRTLTTVAPPTGLALSPDGHRLYVTCASPASEVTVYDVPAGTVAFRIAAGHTAMSPVPTPDGKSLFVCNRFNNDVSLIDLRSHKEIRRIPVLREPVAAAITPDGRHLLVANLLHAGRADADVVAASVTVIDAATGAVIKQLALPSGSGALQDIRISPDGRHAVVSHILARFYLPTTQLERGWMNTNAETIIDLQDLSVLNTVLLDDVDSGASNPWGIAWSPDGRTQVVTHAGTHEISIIDFPALLAKLAKLPVTPQPGRDSDTTAASRVRADVPNDLAFLRDVRRRVKLPDADHGPRMVAFAGNQIITANYFSDSLTVIGLSNSYPYSTSLPLGPAPIPTPARKGEAYFNDATICFQTWQSCATCHPGDARVDALNWDLLNDGIGNPKNNKNLLLAHRTPPAMSLGIRDTAEVAVRAGIRHSLFTVQPEEVATSIDEYLKSLQPVPSPYLKNGKISPAAKRGKRIFDDPRVACASCHPHGLFTDLSPHDVGTRGKFDAPTDRFDTPTLIEVWRTAPYLHDGSAASMREVFSGHNPSDRHGQTSHLSKSELDDLVAYVLSL